MLLFLYGTLLPGLAPRSLVTAVARLRPLGPATVPGRLYDLGPYPGLVPDVSGETRVTGELFAVPDEELLQVFDEYEGTRFRRVPTTATRPGGETLACWVYEYAADVSGAKPIVNGDFRQWCIMRRDTRDRS
jgi:gamma-glutamylcyclotransferase (GGCT)/AIG2-like uncharacterized protein YtfP